MQPTSTASRGSRPKSPVKRARQNRTRAEQHSQDRSEASRLVTFVVILISVVGGGGLIFWSVLLSSPTATVKQLGVLLSGTIGTTILVSGTLSVIYDWYLRRRFLADTETVTRDVVNDVVTRFGETRLVEVLDSSISTNMPARYTNLVSVGLEDAFSSLHVGRWRDKIRKLSSTKIRILKMYIADMPEIEEALREAIQSRDCSAQILLLDPRNEEVLQKRANCLHDMDAGAIRDRIESNIKRIRSIWRRLEPTRREALELRLHSSFVAVSLQGQGDEFTVGLYLRGRTATQGVQLRVRGPAKEMYQHLDHHFKEEWKHALPYDFERGGLPILKENE